MSVIQFQKIIFTVGLVLTACTAVPVKTKPAVVKPVQYDLPKPVNPGEENIDLGGLQNFLRLNRNFDQLGYAEKNFNTCEVGYGYSSTNNCQRKTFVVIQFQLMCRNSEGTISQALTQNDLRPISRKNVKWNLKNATGVTLTDSEGYAQIAMISPESQKTQRLRLTVGNDFLFLRAGEITQMVTPKSWCGEVEF